MAMHEDQLDIDLRTVRRLVETQFPHLIGRRLRRISTAGTVNAIFRIGDDLASRFPLRAVDPGSALESLRAETAAASELASVSPVPTPVPVAIGEPGAGYPLPWSIQTWLPGRDAAADDPTGSMPFARDVAAFIGRLRTVGTRGRCFAGNGRGGHLTDHDEWMELCFRRSERLLDVPRLRALRAEFRELPEVDDDAMCHGDITPPNVLVRDGRLVGVLDGGGFAPADPALDLVSTWHLLDHQQRLLVKQLLGCSDIQWRRGMAWALEQAMGLVWYYVDSNPTMSRWGRRTIERLVAADS